MGIFRLRTIVTHIGSTADYNFFLRLAKVFITKQYRFIFITPKISLYIKVITNGFECHLVFKSKSTNTRDSLFNTCELLSGIIILEEAVVFYNSIIELVDKLSLKNRPEFIFVWNGSSVPTRALVDYAKEKRIKTIFFELSNIPGKIFVDPCGVNASSFLYSNIEVLDESVVDQKKYEEWKKRYYQQKKNEVITKTAIYQEKITNYFFFVDWMGAKFLKLPAIGNMSLVNKIQNKIIPKTINRFEDKYDLEGSNYIFFPMQVSNDSQLLINSSFNNTEGILYCLNESSNYNYDLVVKPHPVESNTTEVAQLSRLKQQYPFYISYKPTFSILENAKEVITINSTVGLEAMILNKKVRFLGRTFYSFFNEDRLKSYILSYLIDIDYFSNELIPHSRVEEIIKKSGLL